MGRPISNWNTKSLVGRQPRKFEWTRDAVMDRVEFDLSGGCWLWLGRTNPEGYGEVSVSHKSVGAHRLSYELFCEIRAYADVLSRLGRLDVAITLLQQDERVAKAFRDTPEPVPAPVGVVDTRMTTPEAPAASTGTMEPIPNP